MRFTTVDPIRDGANWFTYVNNDPVNYVDLWGLLASEGHINWNAVLDGVQAGLDVAGCIPGIGEIADCANGIISLCRGDFLNAGLSFISMVPVVGDAVGKGGKAAGFIAKNGDEIAAATKRVFWTGMGDNGTKAANWVKQNGGITLEMTEAAKNLPDWTPATASKWDAASLDFAKESIGDVTVLVGPGGIRDSSTFSRVEFSELLNNKNVDSINFVYIE